MKLQLPEHCLYSSAVCTSAAVALGLSHKYFVQFLVWIIIKQPSHYLILCNKSVDSIIK